MYKKVEAEIGGRKLTIESGKMARQANGAVLVTYDETVVLVTATAAKKQKPDYRGRQYIDLMEHRRGQLY